MTVEGEGIRRVLNWYILLEGLVISVDDACIGEVGLPFHSLIHDTTLPLTVAMTVAPTWRLCRLTPLLEATAALVEVFQPLVP